MFSWWSRLLRRRANLPATLGFYATIVALAVVYSFYRSRTFEGTITTVGWGPQYYVTSLLKPQNFASDFPTQIHLYHKLLPMRAYDLAARHFGISPTTLMYPYAYVQTVVFLFAIAFLAQTLFRHRLISLFAVMALLLGGLMGLNLACFNQNGLAVALDYLYYGYAHAFRLFAIAFCLRRRYILGAVFLALSVYSHATLGLFGAVFIAAGLLGRPQDLKHRPLWLAAGLWLALTVPYLSKIGSAPSEVLAPEQWIESTRLFSAHWHFITHGLHSADAHRFLFPLILLLCAFFQSLNGVPIGSPRVARSLLGCSACLLMAPFGILFGDVWPQTTLMRIAPHRATDLVTLFGCLFVLRYLYARVVRSGLAIGLLASFAIAQLTTASKGISALPFLVFLGQDLAQGRLGPLILKPRILKVMRIGFVLLCLTVVALMVVSIAHGRTQALEKAYQKLWPPLALFDPSRAVDFSLRAGGALGERWQKTHAFVLAIGLWLLLRALAAGFRRLAYGGMLLACVLVTWWYVSFKQSHSPPHVPLLQAQLWARDFTPPDSLFLLNPSWLEPLSFRDFSERSSMGDIFEWVYSSFCYTGDAKLFREGRARMRQFGVDVDRFLAACRQNGYPIRQAVPAMMAALNAVFLGLTDDDVLDLGRIYGLDYVVRPIDPRVAPLRRLKLAYENAKFRIYEVPKRPPTDRALVPPLQRERWQGPIWRLAGADFTTLPPPPPSTLLASARRGQRDLLLQAQGILLDAGAYSVTVALRDVSDAGERPLAFFEIRDLGEVLLAWNLRGDTIHDGRGMSTAELRVPEGGVVCSFNMASAGVAELGVESVTFTRRGEVADRWQGDTLALQRADFTSASGAPVGGGADLAVQPKRKGKADLMLQARRIALKAGRYRLSVTARVAAAEPGADLAYFELWDPKRAQRLAAWRLAEAQVQEGRAEATGEFVLAARTEVTFNMSGTGAANLAVESVVLRARAP